MIVPIIVVAVLGFCVAMAILSCVANNPHEVTLTPIAKEPPSDLARELAKSIHRGDWKVERYHFTTLGKCHRFTNYANGSNQIIMTIRDVGEYWFLDQEWMTEADIRHVGDACTKLADEHYQLDRALIAHQQRTTIEQAVKREVA